MTEPEPLVEIQDLLHSEYLRERRMGIQKASELLAQGLYRQQLRGMLAVVAQGDLITNLAEYAQEVLDEDEFRHQSYPARYESVGNEHIVGAVCSKGHPNYYEKHIICPGEERLRTLRTDGVEMDLILVKCRQCGEEMTIEVDCRGYK